MFRIGLFSYWINTYSGGGASSALGGALVLGALPRLLKTGRFRYGMLMAVGIVIRPQNYDAYRHQHAIAKTGGLHQSRQGAKHQRAAKSRNWPPPE